MSQSGGGNSCRANARYACNFGNIRDGLCPGYIVKTRNTRKDQKSKADRRRQGIPEPPKDAKYYLEWKGNRPRGTAKGFWFTGKQNLVGMIGADDRGKVRNNPVKLEDWNKRRCLPHTSEGEVHEDYEDSDPNELCDVYQTDASRQRKGCVATDKGDEGKKGIYRKGRRKGSPYQSNTYRDRQRRQERRRRARQQQEQAAPSAEAQELAEVMVEVARQASDEVHDPLDIRGLMQELDKVGDDLPMLPPVDEEIINDAAERAAAMLEEAEAEERNYNEIPEVRKAIDAFVKKLPDTGLFKDYFVPVRMKVPARGPEVWVYQNKHYELREVTRNSRKMVGLFYVGNKNLPKGSMFLPYTGKPLKKAPSNRDYVLTVGEGRGAPVIDSNPKKVGKTTLQEPWVIGLSAFANEPGPDEEPNAYFGPWEEAGGKAALLFATRTIKPGEEVLVCYGSGYEKRDYPSSCYWTSSKDLGKEGVLHFNDNAKDGVPVHWPVVEGKMEPFVTLVKEVCGIISEKHIKDGLTDEEAVIMAWIDKGGRSLRGIAIILPGWVPGSKEIQLLCTESKYGQKMFEHFLKSGYYENAAHIYVKAIPAAMKFWHKMGFRVVENCGEEEPEAVREMLHDNRIIDWTTTRQKGKGVKKMHQILNQHAQNADLKRFLVNDPETKRSVDAVKMRWCQELAYKGTVAPEAKVQREISFEDTDTALTQEQLEQLHTRGYTLLKGGMAVDPDTTYYRQLEDFARNNAGTIFNPDDKRRQVELTGKKQKVAMYADTERFTERVWSKLQKMFPNHTPNDLVVLSSEPGCKEQKAHQDYLEKDLKKKDGATPPPDEIPLGVIVALMDDTYIDVWPGAIKTLSEAGKVKPKRLRFNRGDIVIFRGDLVHAGSAYTKFNMRLHTYMDHPSVKRKFNSTQYVDKMECILDKEDRPDIEEVSRGGGIRSRFRKWRGQKPAVDHQCLTGYEMKEVLGQGMFGKVAKACFKDSCDYAVKIIPRHKINPDEIKITKKLWDRYNIGPKFYDAWECDDSFYVVTELWDGELPQDVCLPNELMQKLCNQVKALHRGGFVHGDIYEKNILVKRDRANRIVDVTLADFGTVVDWGSVKDLEEPDDIPKMKAELKVRALYNEYVRQAAADPYLQEFLDKHGISAEDVVREPTLVDHGMLWKLYKMCGRENEFYKCFPARV